MQSNRPVVIDCICVSGCVGVHARISLSLDQGETFSFKSHSYDDEDILESVLIEFLEQFNQRQQSPYQNIGCYPLQINLCPNEEWYNDFYANSPQKKKGV